MPRETALVCRGRGCDAESVGEAGDTLDRLRRVRQQLAQVGPSSEREDGDFARVAIPDRDADALRDLLVAEQARSVIEIGLAYGSSALAIGEALLLQAGAQAAHLVFDAYQDHFADAGWQALTEAGLSGLVRLVRERSQLVLPRLVSEGFVADAAFVDGSHLFHNVFVDLYFLQELVRPAGLVILDDCQWPSVATAVRYFQLNVGWTPVRVPASTRLSAYRLPDRRVEPRLEDFQPFDASAAEASAPLR